MTNDSTPEDVATRFYEAFARRDAEAMAGLYDDGATFQDPVFGRLDADHTRTMWRTLLGRAPSLTVEHELLSADERTARVRWQADYEFGRDRRSVHNDVRSTLTVRDGLIVDQVDEFSFWRWSRQALGPMGALAGWTPMVRHKVTRQARGQIGLRTG